MNKDVKNNLNNNNLDAISNITLGDIEPISESDLSAVVGSEVLLDVEDVINNSNSVNNISMGTELELEVDTLDGGAITLDTDEEDNVTLEVEDNDYLTNDQISQAYARLQSNISLGQNFGNFLLTPVISDDEILLEVDDEENIEDADDDDYDEVNIELDAEATSSVDITQLSAATEALKINTSDTESSESISLQTNQQRSKDRLIKRLLKSRNDTPVEASREGLLEIMKNTTQCVKEYCSNLHSSFLAEPKRTTKNSYDLYFGLLIGIFQKIYIERLTNNQPTITADEFMCVDLKPYLLNLGQRVQPELRSRIESLEVFTANDLLGSEWQIVRLTSKLNEEIESIKGILTNSNATKNILAGIRTQMLRTYVPNTLKYNDAPYTYVEKVLIDGDMEEFICGHCHGKSTATSPFYLLGILPFQGQDGKIYTPVDIPAANKCEHCGHYNILSVDEVKRLSSATMKLQKALMEGYVKASTLSCSSFAMTRYRASKELVLETLPILEEENELLDNIEEENEVAIGDDSKSTLLGEVNPSELDSAHKRYLKMLSYFKDNADYNARPTVHQIPSVVGLVDISEGRYIFNSDRERIKAIQSTNTFKSNLTNLAKIICGVSGVKYRDLKFNACNSLITHLKGTKLYDDLCYNNTEGQRIASESRRISEYLEELEANEQPKVISTLCGIIGYTYADIIDEKTNIVIPNKLQVFKNAVNSYFNKLTTLANEAIAKRDKLIDDLKDNIRLYSFVNIANIPVVTGVEELTYDEKFVEFLNETADMMILMHLSEDFLKYWKTVLGKSNANAILKLVDVNSLNNFTYAEKILTKTGIMKFEPRFPKIQKEDFLLKSFTLLRDIDLEKLSRLTNIRQAYEDNDIFNLMNRIVSAAFLEETCLTANGEIYTYDIGVFSPVREAITELLPVARDFVAKYGSDDFSRLKFYLSDIFTEEEIASVDARRYKGLKLNILIERQEGESLTDYLKRLSSEVNKVDTKNIRYFQSEYSNIVDKYEVVLLGADLPLMFLDTIKQVKEVITVIDLLYQIMIRDMDTMLSIIRVSRPVANSLIEVEGYNQLSIDKKKLDARNYLIRSIFLVDAFNLTGNLADLDVSNDDANSDMSVGESTEERIRTIMQSNELDRAIKHLPEDAVKLIYELCSSNK